MGIFTPDTTFYAEYTDKGKYVMTWRLSLLFILVFFALSVTFVFIDKVVFTFYFLVFFLATCGFIYLKRTKKFTTVFWLYTSGATLLTGISLNTASSVIHYAEFFWIVSIVIFAFIGLTRRNGLLFLALNSVSIILHMLFFLNTSIAAQRAMTPIELWGTLVEILFALFTIGYLLHQYLIFQSFAEKKLKIVNQELAEQNQIIRKKNEENSVLAKEIHHRVKNNLQIIVSLLRMHSDEVRSEETKRHFAEATNRIMSMSLIHQKLYQSKELSNIDFGSYLKELAAGILITSGRTPQEVQINIVSEVHGVGLKTIVPLGLLLNELITNSVKHAFNKDVPGTITIHVSMDSNNRMTLEYSDTGSWKQQTDGGFGLELIDLLTGQMEGNYERTGSNYRFELNNLDH